MLRAPVTLGDDSKTGAGAVVTKDVPAGKLAVGVPARIREIRPIQPLDEATTQTPTEAVPEADAG